MSFFNGERRAEHLANLWTLFASDQKNPECVSRREKLVPFFIFPGVCPVPPGTHLEPRSLPRRGALYIKARQRPRHDTGEIPPTVLVGAFFLVGACNSDID
jgi:hypothetical protein